ncbi:MAG: hypothetical protein Q7S00_02025 [bacterium]|nr:hypothetical protein [bacterium]
MGFNCGLTYIIPDLSGTALYAVPRLGAGSPLASADVSGRQLNHPWGGDVRLHCTFGKDRMQEYVWDGFFVEGRKLQQETSYHSESGLSDPKTTVDLSSVNVGYFAQMPGLLSPLFFEDAWPDDSLQFFALAVGLGLGWTRAEWIYQEGGEIQEEQVSNLLAVRAFLRVGLISYRFSEYGELSFASTLGGQLQVSAFEYLLGEHQPALQPILMGDLATEFMYRIDF